MNTKDKRSISYWLFSGVVLIYLMIAVGGITRLTNSGLSIVEWKVISGIIPPLTHEQWEAAFQKYKQFPQYEKLNKGMLLPDFKKIFWWEYIHRLLGRVIGVVFIVPFFVFFRKKILPPWLLVRLITIFMLGVLQGFVGWFMVKSGLISSPHVSHFRLALHLLMALLLIAVIVWTIRDVNNPSIQNKTRYDVKWLPLTCMTLLLMQIVFGAFVAGLKAGFSYNTYPLMEGKFYPAHLFSQLGYSSWFDGVLFQFVHRWFAFFVLLAIVALAVQIFRQPSSSRLRNHASFILALTIAQILVGIITLMWQVPLALGVLHQLIAILIFIVLVNVIYLCSTRET